MVVLEPQRWLNKPFPLLSHIESPVNLEQGEWLVVLYQPDCSHCQQLIPGLTARFSNSRATLGSAALTESSATNPKPKGVSSLALIDLSSQAPVEWRVPARVASGRMSPKWEWLVTPPVCVTLRDGRVRDVSTGDDVANVALPAAKQSAAVLLDKHRRPGLSGSPLLAAQHGGARQ